MNEPFLRRTPPVPELPVDEVPSPRQEYNIQRRGARVQLQAGTAAKLQFWDVTLRDISRSGILVEHTQRVQVGDMYRVAFQVDGLHLKVTARAVRSSVSHFVPIAGGERQLVYHTGMEFIDVTDETAKRISAYINRQRTSDVGP
jgi:c-di-GMP-binding flagellar brake protein YcgR